MKGTQEVPRSQVSKSDLLHALLGYSLQLKRLTMLNAQLNKRITNKRLTNLPNPIRYRRAKIAKHPQRSPTKASGSSPGRQLGTIIIEVELVVEFIMRPCWGLMP